MADNKNKNPTTSPVFTREELIVINNALNEVCNGSLLDDAEFQTRVGYSREAAHKVLEKVAKALKY